MTAIGVTGHQMREGIDWDWVRRMTRRIVERAGPGNVLWSCLATGADTIAAEEALSAGLTLKVVIPHGGYEQVFDEADAERYRDLLGRCSEAVIVAPQADRQESYLQAGRYVAELSDLLLVVWDGRPAAGTGGTGDIAHYARTLAAEIVWLDTASSSVRSLGSDDR